MIRTMKTGCITISIWLACQVLLLMGQAHAGTIVAWDFTHSAQGWTPNSAIADLATTSGGLQLNCIADDPSLLSPRADYPTGSAIRVTLRMRSTGNHHGELFYGKDIKAGKSVQFTVKNDGQWHEYVLILPELGPGCRLRLDPSDTTGRVTLAWLRAETAIAEIGLDNGVIHVKVDLGTGGAIGYLSRSGSTRNLVNVHDRGRYIQQSYYAGKSIDRTVAGQHRRWSPWPWNPIGAGDCYGNPARILDYTTATNELYVRTRPLLWDMNDEEAECDFETWVSLHGTRVHVRNRLTCFRTDNIWTEKARHQETPAVYTIGDLANLWTYEGDRPFTRGPLTRKKGADPQWTQWKTNEHWAALVDEQGWGVGVYNAGSSDFIGGFHGKPGGGANDDPTGYIAPLRTEALTKTRVYEYEYDLIVGTLDQIRHWVYDAEIGTSATTRLWALPDSHEQCDVEASSAK